jgi:putative endonuclease
VVASLPKGALHVGRSRDLIRRVWEHRTDLIRGHTKKYEINQLVYYEWHDGWESAAHRENQLKRYRRQWKFNLIDEQYPGWKGLWFEITEDEPIPDLLII